MHRHIKYLVMLLCLPITTQAALTVIVDYGSQSATRYYDSIQNHNAQQIESFFDYQSPMTALLNETFVFPVVTPELIPGEVATRRLTLTGIGTFYLIGDDVFSRDWLTLHTETLRQLNAIGLVVNVQHTTQFAELSVIAQGGLLLPISGSDLAVRLNLTHYPVCHSEPKQTYLGLKLSLFFSTS